MADEPWVLTLVAVTADGAGPSVETDVCPLSDAGELVDPVYPSAGLPDPPTLDSVLAGDASMQAGWTPAEWDGGSPLVGFEVWVVDPADVIGENTVSRAVSDPAAVMLILSGLLNDVTYDVQVRAVNIVGPSVWSNVVTVTPAEGLVRFEEAPPGPEPGAEERVPVPPPSIFAFWPENVVTDEGTVSAGYFNPDNWAGR
jgi:Fibronectin type III domain